jgi:hypothetical protein
MRIICGTRLYNTFCRQTTNRIGTGPPADKWQPMDTGLPSQSAI